MSLDYTTLVSQGRAKAFGVPWAPEELELLLLIERERQAPRKSVADFIRAGIGSLEAYDEAIAEGLTPVPDPVPQVRLVASGAKPKAVHAEDSEPTEKKVKKEKK